MQGLQIGGQSRNSIAILSGGCYAFGKGDSGLSTAMMALASVRTLFGENKRWRRKVKHLPSCRSRQFLWRKCRLIRLTLGRKMICDLVRVLNLFQCRTLVPGRPPDLRFEVPRRLRVRLFSLADGFSRPSLEGCLLLLPLFKLNSAVGVWYRSNLVDVFTLCRLD